MPKRREHEKPDALGRPWSIVFLYRVFCILERVAEGLPGPSLVVITGLDKPNETAFSKAEYRRVRQLGEEHRARSPRSIER